MSKSTREAIVAIYAKGPDAVVEFIEKLLTEIHELQQIVQNQHERITALEARLQQDSHNSNKPPSTDGLKRNIRSLRGKSNRSSGGQEGHAGKTLSMVETPNHVIVHRASRCQRCHGSLEQTATKGHAKRQVFDIPPLRQIEVTEHQCEIKRCPHCGATTAAPFPESVTKAAQYGSRLKSTSVYLMQQHLVPFDRTTELLHDLFGCEITEGSLQNWNREAYQALEPAEASVKEQLRTAPVVHADETGMFCQNKLQWLHVASTPLLTHYALDEKRGKDATDRIDILPHVEGRIIHDFWEPYLGYDCLHGFCNSHILRELTMIVEQYRQPWAHDLIEHLIHIQNKVFSDSQSKSALHRQTLRRYRQTYDAIVQRGLRINRRNRASPHQRGRTKQSKARNLLERLRDHRDEILAFMDDFHVPFTNNLAERDLRMVKVKQKISGTFRSRAGADYFCRIRGYVSTVNKNGRKVFDALVDAFSGHPFIPAFDHSE
jgi:transposase